MIFLQMMPRTMEGVFESTFWKLDHRPQFRLVVSRTWFLGVGYRSTFHFGGRVSAIQICYDRRHGQLRTQPTSWVNSHPANVCSVSSRSVLFAFAPRVLKFLLQSRE